MVMWATMKTTIELPDELLIEAKQAAAKQRRPLKALLEEGLRMVLSKTDRKPRRRQVTLVTSKGGLPPDLDLSSREAMYEWFDKNK
jgi:hypothetical protein